MAKETVKVADDLESVKLVDREKMDKRKNKKEDNKKSKNKDKKTENKKSYLSKIIAELKLVTWPTKKRVLKYSFSTILMIVLLAVFFIGLTALFDLLYSFVQGWIG